MSSKDKNSQAASKSKMISLRSILKVVFLFVTLLSIYLYQCVREFRKQLTPELKKFLMPVSDLKYMFWCTIFACLFRGIIKYFTKDYMLSLYIKNTKKNVEFHKEKVKGYFSSFCWYLFTYIFGIVFVAWNNPLVPKTIGGSMPSDSLYAMKWPQVELAPLDYCYFYIQVGGKMYSLLNTVLFERNYDDFWEMILHHVISVQLLLVCYFSNVSVIGLSVLLYHDPGEIGINFMKIYRYCCPKRLKPDSLTGILALFWASAFVVLRVVLQPISVFSRLYLSLKLGWYDITPYELPIGALIPTNKLCYFLFGVLLLLNMLNIFWSFLLVKTIVNYAIKGDFVIHYGVQKGVGKGKQGTSRGASQLAKEKVT